MTNSNAPQRTATELSDTPCDTTNGMHFMHVCLSCTIDAVLRVNMETVDLWFEFGRIGTDVRRAYQHVWALSATRSKTWDHYMSLPESEEARRIAQVMTRRLPSGRGYC